MLISSTYSGVNEMSVNSFIKLVDLPDYRYQPKCASINYGDLAIDCDTKTISLLDAVHHLSISIFSMADEDNINTDKLSSLSAVISDLAELAIATNKIAQSSQYLAGYQDGVKNEK